MAPFLLTFRKMCFRASALRSSARTFQKYVPTKEEIGRVTSQKAGDNKFIVFLSAHFRMGLMMLLQCEHRESMLNRWLSKRRKRGKDKKISVEGIMADWWHRCSVELEWMLTMTLKVIGNNPCTRIKNAYVDKRSRRSNRSICRNCSLC